MQTKYLVNVSYYYYYHHPKSNCQVLQYSRKLFIVTFRFYIFFIILRKIVCALGKKSNSTEIYNGIIITGPLPSAIRLPWDKLGEQFSVCTLTVLSRRTPHTLPHHSAPCT